MPISKVELDVRWARDQTGARAHNTVIAMPLGYAVWIMDIAFTTATAFPRKATKARGAFNLFHGFVAKQVGRMKERIFDVDQAAGYLYPSMHARRAHP